MDEREAIGKNAIANDDGPWAIEVPFRFAEPMSQSLPYASEMASTASVDVQRLREHVVLTANVAGEQHQLAFNTSTGALLVEGKAHNSRGPFGATAYVDSFLEHRWVWEELFSSRELAECVSRLLPPLPEGIDLRFGPGEGLRNLRLLIAANKFVGYPPTFYEERVAEDSLWPVCPLESRLPRDYSGLPRLYEMAGMPDDEALKRVFFERPELILLMLGMPGAPFGSIAMLRRFFELPDAENLMYELCPHRCSCYAWQWLGSLKGEEAVFEFITTQPSEAIRKMTELLEFGMHELKGLTPEDVEGMAMADIERMLASRKQQRKQREMDLLASLDSHEPEQS